MDDKIIYAEVIKDEPINAVVDNVISVITKDHAQLVENLDFENSGHTGFASAEMLEQIEGSIPTKTSQLLNDSEYATDSSVDLKLATKQNALTEQQIVNINAVPSKVDKVFGKELSTNDYTTAEKTKLAGLSNYDDTELRAEISGKQENLSAQQLQNIADVPNKASTIDLTAQINLAREYTDNQVLVEQTARESADTLINTKAETAQSTAEEARTIAEGKSNSRVFETTTEMINALKSYKATELNIGDNLYIKQLNVPDYWISGILITNTGIYGYYEISPLEGSKVELPDATTVTKGVVIVDDNLNSLSSNPVQNKIVANGLNAKYTKPSNGIPKTDLQSDVQDSLNKADSALQELPIGIVIDSDYIHIDNNYTTQEKNKVALIETTGEGTKYLSDNGTYKAVTSGGGGVTDYTGLTSLPQINSVELIGNKSLEDLGIDIPTQTSDLSNDSNFVVDSNYVHTDNNYTIAEKTKLAGLSNYDDTELRAEISGKQENLSAQQLQNIADIPNKADTSDLTEVSTQAKTYTDTTVSTERTAREQADTAINTELDTVSGIANTAQATAETAKTIAEGASRSKVYDNVTAMQNALKGYSNTELRVGDNLYIEELNVPDYWVSEILLTNTGIYGYYEISELETTKVVLPDATTTEKGVVRVDDSISSVSVNPVQNKIVKAEFDKLSIELNTGNEVRTKGTSMQIRNGGTRNTDTGYHESSVQFIGTDNQRMASLELARRGSQSDFAFMVNKPDGGTVGFRVKANADGNVETDAPRPNDGDNSNKIATCNWVNTAINNSGFQKQLESGTNIKTINGESVLGEGDIEVSGGGTSPYTVLWSGDMSFSSNTTLPLSKLQIQEYDSLLFYVRINYSGGGSSPNTIGQIPSIGGYASVSMNLTSTMSISNPNIILYVAPSVENITLTATNIIWQAESSSFAKNIPPSRLYKVVGVKY